jgi:hypothetical protein
MRVELALQSYPTGRVFAYSGDFCGLLSLIHALCEDAPTHRLALEGSPLDRSYARRVQARRERMLKAATGRAKPFK